MLNWALIFSISLNGQGNIEIKQNIDSSANANNKRYTSVIFRFFDKETKSEMKFMTLNLNNVQILTDISKGEAKVYLPNGRHKFFVDFIAVKTTKKYKIKVNTSYNYEINVFLEKNKEDNKGSSN